jgi:hypothetical protein
LCRDGCHLVGICKDPQSATPTPHLKLLQAHTIQSVTDGQPRSCSSLLVFALSIRIYLGKSENRQRLDLPSTQPCRGRRHSCPSMALDRSCPWLTPFNPTKSKRVVECAKAWSMERDEEETTHKHQTGIAIGMKNATHHPILRLLSIAQCGVDGRWEPRTDLPGTAKQKRPLSHNSFLGAKLTAALRSTLKPLFIFTPNWAWRIVLLPCVYVNPRCAVLTMATTDKGILGGRGLVCPSSPTHFSPSRLGFLTLLLAYA